MDTSSGKLLKCVVVTPEKAVLDEPAEFVALPMFDGELGVLPGRAPLIGRLGAGELRLQQRGASRRYFVDGGFAQVRSDVVTVLTPRAMPADEIDTQAADQELTAARAALPKSPEEREARRKAEQRARAMLHVAQRTRGHEGHG
jgi:F-type H+-transporting ATPase subunit epsilon